MVPRRTLSEATQPAGTLIRRAKARLLRDIGRAEGTTNGGVDLHPRLYPPYGPAEIWERDPDYDRIADANAADTFAIVSHTTGPNSDIVIVSTDDSIFLEHDRFLITGTSIVSGADDGQNDFVGHCIAAADISGGNLTIHTNLNLQTAADLGQVIRLVPPPKLIGRVIQIVNRWHDADLTEGLIVDVEQDDGSDWWDIVAASCAEFTE